MDNTRCTRYIIVFGKVLTYPLGGVLFRDRRKTMKETMFETLNWWIILSFAAWTFLGYMVFLASKKEKTNEIGKRKAKKKT